ncbi:uncharacterized protein B0I36DRAFT_286611 [Microdochium trichocladiopsis]|uniref:SsuA/THI5-like domain-containing protein n=1 Tax=Microdochium trichocladiopsis TaxID=1682393 RepID=A0A9P8YFJ1_9PEZI|nr:uncharacterized protein B0I36DRAFT_286611 [Microdochium trichocladiopsis]KAH7036011.1 hypothetical protein B0I36DRAFT_286611 [Microdochium trichocladiopsis]
MHPGSVLVLALLAGAQAADTVQYGAFLKTATYSVANALGFFTKNNLEVVYNQVPNSTAAFDSILDGQYDILTATVDNALNYRFNQAQPITVLGQLDQGPGLVLAAVQSITSAKQLKGKPIIVDSPVSGYAYLLRKILSSHGLELGADYYFMTVGGTAARYSALLTGQLPNGTAVYATILNYPFTEQAAALNTGKAPSILGAVADVVAPITSSAFTIRQQSLADPVTHDRLVRFTQSMYAANEYLLEPRNKECAVSAIAAQLNITSAIAQSAYTDAINSLTGEVSPDGSFGVSTQGIRNVKDVRAQYGGFAGAPAGLDFDAALRPGPGQLIDYGIRDEAVLRQTLSPLKSTCEPSTVNMQARSGDLGA